MEWLLLIVLLWVAHQRRWEEGEGVEEGDMLSATVIMWYIGRNVEEGTQQGHPDLKVHVFVVPLCAVH